MRVRAREVGILVPEFVHALNDAAIRQFTGRVPAPWVLKPRSEAATAGIKKVNAPEELWYHLDQLGDQRSFYVLEQFVHGDIYHVDAIVSEREVVFAEAHHYGRPPMDLAHAGGLFTTRTLLRESAEAQAMAVLNRELLAALGLLRGVTHTEFIRGREDGRFYFLETAARVGGAYIAEVVEAATGVNLWCEWAKIEIGGGKVTYQPPTPRNDYAGVILSLARQEWPDTSAYDDPEIVGRIRRLHHAGLIVASKDPARVESLLESYGRRFYEDFHAMQPPLEKPR
jgi:biotin carboxylase